MREDTGPYTEEYESVKTCILTYFVQCLCLHFYFLTTCITEPGLYPITRGPPLNRLHNSILDSVFKYYSKSHRKPLKSSPEVPFHYLSSRKFSQWPNSAPHSIVEPTIIVPWLQATLFSKFLSCQFT